MVMQNSIVSRDKLVFVDPIEWKLVSEALIGEQGGSDRLSDLKAFADENNKIQAPISCPPNDTTVPISPQTSTDMMSGNGSSDDLGVWMSRGGSKARTDSKHTVDMFDSGLNEFENGP